MGPSGHFTHFYLYVDLVWSLLIVGTCCMLGRAPRTKETARFSRVVSGYPTSTSISQVDGLSTGSPRLGRHKWDFKFPSI